MKKHKYQIGERVFVYDDNGQYAGTVTAHEHGLYKVEYDGGGYDWLLYEECLPISYKIGDYVKTMDGVGTVTCIDPEYDMITVCYGEHWDISCYYEHEVKPALKPSLWAKLTKKDVYRYAF